MAYSISEELCEPPSPAGIMRMASISDSLWDRVDIGTDLEHSGPSASRRRFFSLHRTSSNAIEGSRLQQEDGPRSRLGQEDGTGSRLQQDNGVGSRIQKEDGAASLRIRTSQGHQMEPRQRPDHESPSQFEGAQQQQKQQQQQQHQTQQQQQQRQQWRKLIALKSGQSMVFEDAPRYLRREFILSGYYVGEPLVSPFPSSTSV